MKLVIQRVSSASVRADGRVVGEIALGFLVLVGAVSGDTAADAEEAARKVAGLRVFDDAAGKMNLSLADVGGAGPGSSGPSQAGTPSRSTSVSSRRSRRRGSPSRRACSARRCR